MKSIQNLREQKTALAREYRNLLDTSVTNWGPEAKAKIDDLAEKITAIDEQIEAFNRAIKIEDSLDNRAKLFTDRTGVSVDEARNALEQDRRAWCDYLRNGIERLPESARGRLTAVDQMTGRTFQITNTTPSVGGTAGALVPTTVMPLAIAALRSFGGMREAATTLATSAGNTLSWATYDDTSSEGEIIGENSSATDNDDIPFGSVSIGAYKFGSKVVPISIELLQDAVVPVDQLVQDALLMRIARGMNHKFTTGTGSGEPYGVAARAASGKVGTTGQTTSIIYGDLVDLEHSVDPAYRLKPTTRFMLADSSLKVIKKLVDGNGRPLWLPGLGSSIDSEKNPSTIMGYPYTINQHVAAMAANAKSVFFGDFSKYLIRDVMEMQVFRFTDSNYVKKGQIGFLAIARASGDMIDATYNSIKYYANSAT